MDSKTFDASEILDAVEENILTGSDVRVACERVSALDLVSTIARYFGGIAMASGSRLEGRTELKEKWAVEMV